ARTGIPVKLLLDAVGSSTYLAFKKALDEQIYVTNTDYFEPFDLWQENHIYPSNDGLSIFIHDITERKKTELELKKTNEQLHQLAAHLQHVREMEQKRIAREIHDELGQQITGLKMDVAWMKKKVNGHDAAGFLHDKLDQMTELLDVSVQTVRKISSSLRPSLLDDLGLIAALEWQTKEFIKRFAIPTNFTSSERLVNVSPDMATGLFRLYQESLTNVARHAQATEVNGSLTYNDHHLILKVTDNGKGFDADLEGARKTMGLLGMKERVLMMGGTLHFDSAVGKGTSVTVTVPFEMTEPVE
ncbi:MAG: sensor histidine kinase, partial [Chitinophagaceae bacterium]